MPKGTCFYVAKTVQKQELQYTYPAHLVATEPKPVSRVMWVDQNGPQEISLSHLISQIAPEDIFIINETKVIPCRVFSEDGLEILFLQSEDQVHWDVLCPAKKWSLNKERSLPGGVQLTLQQKGLPQKVRSSLPLNPAYFLKYGDMPLPPYIQEARGERRARSSDRDRYQTAWAKELGSLAAPTASLHFSTTDLDKIRNRGAGVEKLCLHVGLGTFLPIHAANLDEHTMHFETVQIPRATWSAVQNCRKQGGRVWALGSTVVRALESVSGGLLSENPEGWGGSTNLFIRPPYDFKVVDCMLTNFHQPESTLLAMVMAFAGTNQVKECYQWAIDRQFRLFSYGDLSVWIR